MVMDIGFLPDEKSCCAQWTGSASQRRERELGHDRMNDAVLRFCAAMTCSCTALPRDAPAALLPAPRSPLPRRRVRSRPGSGSSDLGHFFERDKNVMRHYLSSGVSVYVHDRKHSPGSAS